MQPNYIEIEPARGCNLRCRMCHVSYMNETVEYLDIDKVDYSFLRGATVTLGAVFEPCIHPGINSLVDKLNRQGCRIILITNGHNLHKKQIPALFDSDLCMVTFSFDGISKATYELVRVGGNFERTLSNIENFRASFHNSNALFAINFTALKCNMHEIPSAPAFWNARNIDVLRFIAMTVREPDDFIYQNSLWNVRESYFKALTEAATIVQQEQYRLSLASPFYHFKLGAKEGVVSSANPAARHPPLYPREHQYGAAFGMTFPCKSPFVAIRILWDGTVMLCHNQPIGNLYQSSIKEIWEGAAAIKLRKLVLTENSQCNSCDYFRLCINSHFIDLEKIENHYSQPMLDRGSLTLKTPDPFDMLPVADQPIEMPYTLRHAP
jgi:radical SAM protein with 4Fe4S-binding SPASM domain